MKRLFSVFATGNVSECEVILDTTAAYIRNKYSRYFEFTRHSEFVGVVKILIACTVLRLPVSRNQQIGVFSIDEMEKAGLLFLEPLQTNSLGEAISWRISYPFISLYMMYTQTRGLSSQLEAPLKLLQEVSFRMGPLDNERMDLNFLVYKLEFLAMVTSNKDFFSLSQLVPLRPDQPNSLLQFPKSFAVHKTPNRIDASNFLEFYNKNCTTEISAWHNSGTSSFADAFIFLKTDSNKPFIIFIQSKQSIVCRAQLGSGNQTVHLFNNASLGWAVSPIPAGQSVTLEHLKVEQVTSPLQLPHLFIYITDHKASMLDKKFLKPDELLIDIVEQKAFFGDVIAFRRLSCITDR
jgi:hypothetical protein